MATNLLWFVMAGFLLGFATSTLWEWFYFRKERLKLTDRRIRELEAKLRDAEVETESKTSTVPGTGTDSKRQTPAVAAATRAGTRTSAWSEPAYRSPGVFLESEEGLEGEGLADETARGQGRAQAHDVGFDDEVSGDEYDDTYSDDYSDEVYGPDRTPIVPTVDSVSFKSTTSKTAATQSTGQVPATTSQPSPHAPPKSQFVGPAESPAKGITSAANEKREEQPTPADSLRAKLGTQGRTRQEVLAALRRNSEAAQRGEYPPPPQSSSLVSPFDPNDDARHDELADAASATPKLSPARLRWVNDAKLTTRSKEFPDDLSKIRGIGDVYKQRLYRAGIYTWKQLVETDTETLRRATSAYPSSNVDEWLTQAETLMAKHGRKDAVYSGPPPDDMTKILGIGPVGAAVLYRAGICTYEQLASTPEEDLKALFPIAVAGDMPDFADWIERATRLADEKHAD